MWIEIKRNISTKKNDTRSSRQFPSFPVRRFNTERWEMFGEKMDNGENSPPTIPELSFPFAAIFSLKKKKRKTIGGKQTAAFSCHEAYFLGGHLNFLIRKCCAAEVNTKKKSFSPAPIHSFISIGWGVWISFWWNELLWVHSSSVADSSGAGGPTFSTNRFHSKYAPHTREFISTQKS